MKVFVAGATGALGRPLTQVLLAHGHTVIGLTNTPSKRAALERAGVQAVAADALDSRGLRAATATLEADAVVHALTALPSGGPRRARDLAGTNALRAEGTANLLDCARRMGARRFVAESFILGYGFGDWGSRVLTEEQPLAEAGRNAGLEPILASLRSLEDQVLAATRAGDIEGVVLRYGLFYGPSAGTDVLVRLLRRRQLPLPGGGRGVAPWIFTDDAATATVSALERGAAGAAYNVVDDEPVTLRAFLTELAAATGTPAPYSVPRWLSAIAAPYLTIALTTVLRASNAKAKDELGWTPSVPTYREGIARLAATLARQA